MSFGTSHLSIDSSRLLRRIEELGQIGRDSDGKLIRLAASDADKAGRDLLASWIKEAGLELAVDRIGNLFGIWRAGDTPNAPLLIGSHIDTVIHAGIYDGCYGVLSGLEVIQTLRASGFAPLRPIVVCAFTNEEGVRYAPDMMGSLVFAGGMPVEEALAAVGTDGSVLGDELARIGYLGNLEAGFMKPYAYLELHIEQGPILEAEGIPIGAVEGVTGISWMRIAIEGTANHAGTTPMSMRRDAGYAAARVITFLNERVASLRSPTVVTVGCIEFEPNAINVIPARATFTVDLRDADEQRLQEEESALAEYLAELAVELNVKITTEPLARVEPAQFDARIVELVEAAARQRGFSSKRMISGAVHDAQMVSRICPAGMIFVPSIGGISHNPNEFTPESDLVAGANVLLDVTVKLAGSLSLSGIDCTP